jgi:formate--tetrahydrofolate ligase
VAFARGGAGAAELAEAVVDATDQPNGFAPTYSLDASIPEKIEAIATRVYGAAGVHFLPTAEESIARFAADGLGRLPVCMAKTHLSLSDDAALLNAPEDFTLHVRDVRAYTGAGWLVPLCGEVMTMPGLGERAAAFEVDIDAQGRTVGLF